MTTNTCANCGMPMPHGLTHPNLRYCIAELQRRVASLEREELRLEGKRRELEAKRQREEWLVDGSWNSPDPSEHD